MEDLLNATLNATLNVTHAPHAPGGHKDPTPPSRTVLIIMITILVAAFLHHHQRYLFFPFTVLMFLFGMGIGGLTHAAPSMKDYIMIQHIDAHLILHVFLPVLIYDGSAALKLSVLSKVMKQALILAGPGLVLHTVLVGIFMRYVLYDFTWPAALLFGSILSATDPVAVVAILKELDADTAVTVLTDGEAIFNDGTAIIFFAIFYAPAQVSGSFAPWHEYIWRIPLYTVGAYAFGKICGIIVLFCMTRVHNEPVVETLVQLGGAYLVFWVADTPMQSSGVLAVCFMALHIASNRSLMTNELSEMNENFWELTVFIANALIFALVGLIIATDAIPKASGRDYGMLIALYLLIHVFRAIMIGTFAPFFGSGYAQLTKQRFGMLVYGALRGGVALTLALVVARDDSFSEEVRNKTLFLTGGIVILFIAINGSTSKYIVEFLGLDLKPPYRNYQFRHGQKLLDAATEEKIRELRGTEGGKYVNWPLLRKLTIKGFSEHLQDDARVASKCSAREFIDPALIRAMKHALQRQREEGLISSSSFSELMHVFDNAIDTGKLVEMSDVIELLSNFPNVEGGNGCLTWWDRTYQMLFGTYTAHAVMQVEILTSFLDLLDAVKPTIMMLVSRRFTVKPQLAWLDAERAKCLKALEQCTQRYSSITCGLHTMRHAQRVLRESMHAVDDLECGRGFPRSQAQGMKMEISHLQHHIAALDLTTIPEPADVDVFESSMIFDNVARKIVDHVLEISTLHFADKNAFIHPQGNDFCVLVRGRLAKVDRSDSLTYGPGDFFGLHAALANFKSGNYVCLDQVRYYRINGEKFTEMLMTIDNVEIASFKRNLWSLCGARVAQSVLHRYYPFSKMSSSELLRICNTGKLKQCPLAHEIVTNTPGTACMMTPNMDASVVFPSTFDMNAMPPSPPPAQMRRTASYNSVDLELETIPFGGAKTDDKVAVITTQSSEAAAYRSGIMRNETFTDPDSAWFLLSGSNVSGTISSRSIRALPQKHIIQWAPGAIVFHLRDFAVSSHEIKLTGIPLVDSYNIKLDHILSSFKNAEADGVNVLQMMAPHIVSYCAVFAVLDALFESMNMRSERETMARTAEEFCIHVLNWLIGQHVAPVQQSSVIHKLQGWFDIFAAVEHPWAHTIVTTEGFDPEKYQLLGDVVPGARMTAWWKAHNFLFDTEESDDETENTRSGAFTLRHHASFSEQR